MSEARIDPQAAPLEQPDWQDYVDKRVHVYALYGAYTFQRAPAVLNTAREAAKVLTQLLKPQETPWGDQIIIYLTDPFSALSADVALKSDDDSHQRMAVEIVSDSAMVWIVQPEMPDDPLIWALVRLLVARWFGRGAASATPFLDGLAGVVAARTGAGPTVQNADATVRAELAAGRAVSLLSYLAPESQQGPESPPPLFINRAATSFVAFLLDAFGPRALQEFLVAHDPGRRDQAAISAYQRPLSALEGAWHAHLQRGHSHASTFRHFLRRLDPFSRLYWWRGLEVLVYMLFGVAYSLALPLAGKHLIDKLIPKGNLDDLFTFLLVLVGVYLLYPLIEIRQSYVTSWITQHILLRLQERLYAHLQRLSSNFYNQAKVGDIISHLTNDMQAVEYALAKLLDKGVYVSLKAMAAAITLILLSPLLGALVLLGIPLYLIGHKLLHRRFERNTYELQQWTGEATAALQESLSAHAVVAAFGLEQRMSATYHALRLRVFQAAMRLSVTNALHDLDVSMAMNLGKLLVLGVGGYLVIDGQFTLGTLVAAYALLPSLHEPSKSLAELEHAVALASGSTERISALLDEPITVDDKPGVAVLPALSREIRLQHVTFSYGGDSPVLHNLDLTIPASSHVAVVGPSGSGKSTLVNLLLRFWDPEQGHVLFDGTDVRDVTLSSLRGQIGLVFQETFVFHTTIRENIATGWPGATDAQIAAAARAAELDTFIASLPAGYDTLVGERGVRLSGGQRQRLAIARALLRDPRILILDEATGALDAQTEGEILDTLALLRQGRTTITITHRLPLAATADHIFVLDQGRLVEQGAHVDLMQANGLYRRLYDEQTSFVTGGGPLRTGVDVERLRAIPLFAELGTDVLEALAERLILERYAAGEDVVYPGDPADKLYLISRGRVEVLVHDGVTERRITTLHAGDYFGEMALLSDQPRSAVVRTIVPSQLYSLGRADFMALYGREPELQRAVSETVVGRQRALAVAASGEDTNVVVPGA